MTNYPPADVKSQWFQDNYPGADTDPSRGVIHTTEGSTWPGYEGGATAPGYTAKPQFGPEGKYLRLDWRAHFPDEKSSRALRNESGGVQTNTEDALQVELIGTCSPDTHRAWARNGVDHVFWPAAPLGALEDLAEFIAWVNQVHGVPIVGPQRGWLPYPASYGRTVVRFSGTEWVNFRGWCGHQHAPENTHGDPGNLAWETVMAEAKALLDDGSDDPLALDVSVLQASFRAFLDDRKPPRGRGQVRRLQRLLNQVHGAGLPAGGGMNRATVAAWRAHEHDLGGKGRDSVPDYESLKALATLAGDRYQVRK